MTEKQNTEDQLMIERMRKHMVEMQPAPGSVKHLQDTLMSLPGVTSVDIDEDFETVSFTATVRGGWEPDVRRVLDEIRPVYVASRLVHHPDPAISHGPGMEIEKQPWWRRVISWICKMVKR